MSRYGCELPRTPRTDPYERDWRIRLLPRMGSGKALLRSTLQPKATPGRPCGCAPFLPRFRWYRPESFPRSPLPPCETADAVSKNTAPSPRNARSTVASGMVTSTARKVQPSTIMAAVPRPRDREPARRTPASTRSAAKSWQACWAPWPATRRMPTRWPLAVICGSAWLKLPAAPAGMPPDRPNGDERAPRGVGSEPGDRQDWQRISGKMRRKSMPVLSVPGALVGGDEVTVAVFHELSRAEGPSQQSRKSTLVAHAL